LFAGLNPDLPLLQLMWTPHVGLAEDLSDTPKLQC
jgi:hypothetical protein